MAISGLTRALCLPRKSTNLEVSKNVYMYVCIDIDIDIDKDVDR